MVFLKKIKEILDSPTFERQEALKFQHKNASRKRSRLDNKIQTIEKTIKHGKGEIQMSIKDKFEGFDFSKNPYEEEEKRRGDKAIDEANEKAKNMTLTDQERFNEIFCKLASLRHFYYLLLKKHKKELRSGISF